MPIVFQPYFCGGMGKTVALLSDFGIKDATVAATKGILLQYDPSLTIVDNCHQVTIHHQQEFVYMAHGALKHLPAPTIHLLLFDLFPFQRNKLILATHNSGFVIAADNGLLPLLLEGGAPTYHLVGYLDEGSTIINWLHMAAKLIAQLPTAASLLQPVPPEYLHTTTSNSPTISGKTVYCDAISIDTYGNVVLNVTKKQFDKWGSGRPFELKFTDVEQITELSTTYTDVKRGYELCRFNSAGYLEININRGDAARLFGLKQSAENNIQITFA